jgi:hypothetical protein
MRPRLVFIVVMAILLAGFAALNWSEMNRASPLSFGLFVTDASLGMVLLAALGLTLLVFLLSSAVHESRLLYHTHRHNKALDVQRNLAEKAEASRFTDLRSQLESHLRETRQREAVLNTEMEKSMAQQHRELRGQLEQMHRALAARMIELENRIDARLGHATPGTVSAVQPAPYVNPAQRDFLDTEPRDLREAREAHAEAIREDLDATRPNRMKL